MSVVYSTSIFTRKQKHQLFELMDLWQGLVRDVRTLAYE
jgi:hypothetical protein